MELPECDWLIQEQWDEIVLKFNYIRFVGYLMFIDDKITKFRKERQCDWCHEKKKLLLVLMAEHLCVYSKIRKYHLHYVKRVVQQLYWIVSMRNIQKLMQENQTR